MNPKGAPILTSVTNHYNAIFELPFRAVLFEANRAKMLGSMEGALAGDVRVYKKNLTRMNMNIRIIFIHRKKGRVFAQ